MDVVLGNMMKPELHCDRISYTYSYMINIKIVIPTLVIFIILAIYLVSRKSNEYYLKFFSPNQKYYLCKYSESNQQGGVLEGTIIQIGEVDGIIFAQVDKLHDGDKDGFYIINDRKIIGPVDLKNNYPKFYDLLQEPQFSKFPIRNIR